MGKVKKWKVEKSKVSKEPQILKKSKGQRVKKIKSKGQRVKKKKSKFKNVKKSKVKQVKNKTKLKNKLYERKVK